MSLHNRPLFDHSRNCKREMAVNLTRHPPFKNVETILSEVIKPFANTVIQLCAPCTAKCAGNQHRDQVGMRVQQRFKSVCACAQSGHSRSLWSEETLGPWLPKERPLKTLIRLRMRAV